ncbi:MAG: hypothetical protein IJN66_09625 [Muribaculaceae bacterium]|nr:hypothetical protein [Muribaculaceae bacterium]
MQTEIAGIKALIEQYKTDVTAEYTDAIKTAITACETSMKEWVNGVLADGYYTKAELDGKITALETQVTEGDTALQKEIDELKASLAKAESDLTAAYKKAIEDTIETNNGVINEAIASAVEAAQNALQSKIDTINNRINTLEDELDELKNNFANRIQSLEYIPIYSDGKMGFDYATRSVKLYFRISPASIAMLIKSGNVTAFARETENPNTRAINPEVQLGVAEVNGDKTGVIEVKIVESGESTFSTKFWEGENEAVIYIKITDDNGNDITSDMVPIVATGYVAYLGDITDAAMAKTGDVALTDGSFVSNAKIAEMTEAQKAAMAGIVFWTVADTDPTGRTYPASLTEDKVMNADFPHCTHGLIVSFKNISTGCVWQGIRSNNETNNIESIYSNFQNTDAFNPTNKDEYTAIGTNVTEENI